MRGSDFYKRSSLPFLGIIMCFLPSSNDMQDKKRNPRENLLFLLCDLHLQQSNPFLLPPWQWTQLVKRLNFIEVWGGKASDKILLSKLKHIWQLVDQISCLLPNYADYALNPNNEVGFFIIRQKTVKSRRMKSPQTSTKDHIPPTEASSFYMDQHSHVVVILIWRTLA